MGKRLGSLIRTARTNAGFTQAQLAAEVGVSASDIGRYERAEAEPTQQVVKDIAKACGVTQKSLLDAMPKTSARTTSSGKTTSSSSRRTTSTGTSMKVSATEKRLVELYRAADTDTRKRAMQVLKGEETAFGGSDVFLNTIGTILADGSLGDLMGNINLGGILRDAPQQETDEA